MWLIHTTTLQLEEFFERELPEYSILSHTWGKDEVSFHEMQSNRAAISDKAGYRKIVDSCAQALKDGFQYIWIDTCCIDKKSSAELSEAINSMFLWYKKALRCYVYLADVEQEQNSEGSLSALDNGNLVVEVLRFEKSRWFTRGWTLQELLAPSDLVIYSRSWKKIGSKTSLAGSISAITGIDITAIEGRDLSHFSIAQKMSWASKRNTTRIEDVAYCLLGIFDINMPLLYGEGNRAFLRLQEEILKTSDDHSLFTWTDPNHPESAKHSLFAKSPIAFRNAGHITEFKRFHTTSYSITNQGLTITLPCVLRKSHMVGLLNCRDDSMPGNLLGIYLENLSDIKDGPHSRVLSGKLCSLENTLVVDMAVDLKQLVIPMNPSLWWVKWYGLYRYQHRLQDERFRSIRRPDPTISSSSTHLI